MKKALERFFDRLQGHKQRRRIAVVGDAMIDEYYYVTADRVSPEFPIPVMLSPNDEPHHTLPGGAANVCLQLKHFPCDVDFYGITDAKCHDVLVANDINDAAFVNATFCDNPIKKRIYQNEFPLCRWDIEKPNFGIRDQDLKTFQRGVYDKFDQAGPYDCVIFSDYDKGMFSEKGLGARPWVSRDLNPIMIVDPKHGPLERWRGASILKPNAKEAQEMTGRSDWREQCEVIMNRTECTSVVITQGGDGIVGVVMGREFEYRPQNAIQAESVVGAGDCFVSILGLCMALQIDVVEAVGIAFEAGAVYVQRKHNEPVRPEEMSPDTAKFRTPEELKDVKEKLVFTNGCFDIAHVGHVELLRQAKEYGEKLVVAVNSDDSVRMQNKADDRPINSVEYRCAMLAALDMVDYVTIFNEKTPQKILETIKPDVLVKGGDWQLEDIVGHDIVSEVKIIPLVQGVSTTKIIERIRNAS